MITSVEIDVSPMLPGEERTLKAWSDSTLTVDIRCFVSDPPPPGYRPCSSCGSITIESGVAYSYKANEAIFQEPNGALIIAIRDASGDEQSYQVGVVVEDRNQEPMATA
jgi:hypothetical protein